MHLLLPLIAGLASAADKATVADLSWIAGHWRAAHQGTVIEEVWTAPEGGAMLGMFRLVKGGQPEFYELVAIEQAAAGPTMRIRHFSPGLKSWEKADGHIALVLSEVKPDRALFEADGETLQYARAGDRLTVTLTKPGPDGLPHPMVFTFERQP